MLYRLGTLVLLLVLMTGAVRAQQIDRNLLIAPVSLTLSPDEAYRAAISFAVQENAYILYTDPNARLLRVALPRRGGGLTGAVDLDNYEATLVFEESGPGSLLRVAHHVTHSVNQHFIRVGDRSKEVVDAYITRYRARYDPARSGTPGE